MQPSPVLLEGEEALEFFMNPDKNDCLVMSKYQHIHAANRGEEREQWTCLELTLFCHLVINSFLLVVAVHPYIHSTAYLSRWSDFFRAAFASNGNEEGTQR